MTQMYFDTPSWFFFNSAIDVIYFFHFRKNIAIIAAVVSVTTIILIVAIILVLWKSKSITHKCYLIYFVWGKQSKSFPKWLSVNDKVDDQTLHASKTVHACRKHNIKGKIKWGQMHKIYAIYLVNIYYYDEIPLSLFNFISVPKLTYIVINSLMSKRKLSRLTFN